MKDGADGFSEDAPNHVGGFSAGQLVGAGRFRLIRLLGQGGMGVVWLAHDSRLDEEVALKFLRGEISHDAEALDDMRRETRKSRKLSHPSIIRIHDLFEADGEPPFISMEFVEGTSMASLKAQQPHRLFSWSFLTPLIRQLCDALEYAHSERVVHRDLKPANMLLDGNGRLRLADFGIAATATDSISRLTRQWGSSGTPVYMSPQQMHSAAPRPSDDIYSIGATLYELLTSKPPFYTGDIYRQVQEVSATPIEDRLADLELENDVPPDVSALILACLAKNAEERPQSVTAVAAWIGLGRPADEAHAVLGNRTGDYQRSDEVHEPVGYEPTADSEGTSKKIVGVVLAVMLVLAIGGFGWRFLSSSQNSEKRSVSGVLDIQTDTIDKEALTPEPKLAAIESPAEVGFVSLFNGRDLTGWSGDPRYWSVKDGAIVGEANDTKDNSFLIWTNGTPANFELRFSFTFPEGNSGVAYRGEDLGNWAVFGYQYVVVDHNNKGSEIGNLFESGAKGARPEYKSGRGGLGIFGARTAVAPIPWDGKGKPNRRVDNLGQLDVSANLIRASVNQNGWNEGAVIARGNKVTHMLNGQVCAVVEDNMPGARPVSGVIGLAIAPGARISFKDIRIVSFPEDSAAESGRPVGQHSLDDNARESPPTFVARNSYANFKSIGLTPQRLPLDSGAILARAYGDFFGRGATDMFAAVPTYDSNKPIEEATPSDTGFWMRQSDGSFQPKPGLLIHGKGGIHPRKAIVADFNRDGRPDVFVACHGYDRPPYPGERNKVVLSQPNGTFQVRDAARDIGFFHGATAADVNNDGAVDVLAVNSNAQEPFTVFLNEGLGSFKRDPVRRFPDAISQKHFYSIDLVDVTGDGKLDLLLGGHEFGDVPTVVLTNPGNFNFVNATVTIIPPLLKSGVVLDFTITGQIKDRAIWLLRSSPKYDSIVVQRVQWPSLASAVVYEKETPQWMPWLIPVLENGRHSVASDDVSYGVEISL